MIITKLLHRRLYRPDDASGGGGTVDRGDFLPDTDAQDVDPENPDAELKNDPKVKELEEELKGDADGEGEGEEGEKAEDKPKKKDSRIPLSRHEAVLQKEREKRAELERQLAQYQNGQQVANLNEEITKLEDNVVALEKEYAKLLTDGEIDKATEVMAKIRKTERQMNEARSDMKIQAAEARATERARYNVALERIESAYPELNPDHDDYDEEVMTEVVELKEAYQLKGLTPTAALQKAVKLLVEPKTTRQEMATSATPRVSAKDVAAERKKDAAIKTAKAIEKTPPSLTKSGLNSDKLGGGAVDAATVMKMSQKEFAALSEATLAQMRGDEL